MEMPTFEPFTHVVLIGMGATALMDIWLQILNRFGVPTQNFALLGRWIGHWRHGIWRHEAIAAASPVRGEAAIGWAAHYAIGIAFAALLVTVQGKGWIEAPSLKPALLTGFMTVAAPLLLLQPAMGAGIASSKTRMPVRNSFKSLANHMAFGWGLYFAATAIRSIGV